ncbi:MAG: APC family permease [Pseudomonadales bacterium]
MSNDFQLRKSIGFWGLFAMSLGVNIGGALFALTTLAAGYSGPSLPIAMLIAATPVMLALAPFCVLSLTYPTTSASYRYAQLVSPTLAVVSLLTSVVCMGLGGMPLFGLVAGNSLSSFVGLPPAIVGAVVIAFFYLVNVIGLNFSARIQMALTAILASALLLFIVSGSSHVASENFSPLFPNSLLGTLAATGILYTFCAGGLFVVDLGGEVIKADRAVPRALVAGMVAALLIYLGIMFVTVGVNRWSSLDGMPLTSLASQFMDSRALLYFTIGGALCAAITTINGVFALQSRLILAVADDGLISDYFSSIHAKYGTPHRALGLVALISITSLLAIPSITFFASMLNFTMLMGVSFVTLAAFKVASDYPQLCAHSAFSISVTSLKSICWMVVCMNVLIAGFLALRGGWASIVFIGIVASAFAYSQLHRTKLQLIHESTTRHWQSLEKNAK